MNYVAIDFETANGYAGGACAVALARFDEEGRLLDSYYSLIRPKHPYFDPGMSAVHKLKDEDCLVAPEFDVLWPHIREFIGRDVLVAHNAVFDMGVLKGCFEAYDLEAKATSYFCTYIVAKKVWPKMLSYKLTYLCDHFGIEGKAHYALDDAIMCGKLFGKQCYGNLSDLLSLRRFLIKLGIEAKVIEHQQTELFFL